MYVYVYCLGISNSLLIRPTLCVETRLYHFVLFELLKWLNHAAAAVSCLRCLSISGRGVAIATRALLCENWKLGHDWLATVFGVFPLPDPTRLNSTASWVELSWVGSGSWDGALVNGERQILTPYRIETPKPIDKKFCTRDYVQMCKQRAKMANF